MTQVQLRLSEHEVKQLDKWIDKGRFKSRSDAVRTILAIYEDQQRKEESYEKFIEAMRKFPGKRTPAEQKKAEKELETMSQEDLFRKFGFRK